MTTTDMTHEQYDEETGEVKQLAEYREPSALKAIARSEVEAQIDAAHRHPRSLRRFQDDALSMATLSQEVAMSCIYSLPRGGKNIAGPSVRLAEICASAWGNMHAGARPVSVDETDVTCQGVAWDIQRNVRITVESKRRITGKNGQRFNDDMIIMAQNAANSIALRNAIFRVIPRAYVDLIYAKVREVAVGNASTLVDRRAKLLERLGKMGASIDRVLHALDVKGVDDIGLDQMEILIGLGTAVKEGEKTLDEVFPVPPKDATAVPEGKRIALGAKPAEQANLPTGEAKK